MAAAKEFVKISTWHDIGARVTVFKPDGARYWRMKMEVLYLRAPNQGKDCWHWLPVDVDMWNGGGGELLLERTKLESIYSAGKVSQMIAQELGRK